MNFLYNVYFFLPNFEKFGLFGKVINKLLEIILKRIFDIIVPLYFNLTSSRQISGLNEGKRDVRYIVSLTSFPARIDLVWIAIECLLRQSFKPDMIVLWLSEDQFKGLQLPNKLEELEKRGLLIKYCKGDLKAHKKYLYSMQQFPNDNIITVDDDLYYDENLLKRVVSLHNLYPDLICANRAHKIKIKNGQILPYKKWERRVTTEVASHLNFSTGGAGTLYPPMSLVETAFNEELIKELCYNADDVWLKVLSIMSDKKVITNRFYSKNLISISKTQRVKLVTHNVQSGGNDHQLNTLLKYFKIDINNLD